MSDTSHPFSQSKSSLVRLSLVAAVALALTACGSNYRPVTYPIVSAGPAQLPSAYAFVVSAPSTSVLGIGTVIDFSGDSIMATSPLGPTPIAFTMSSGGSQAWSLDSDGTVANIPVSTNLQQKNVQFSTLSPYTGIDPVVNLFSGSVGLYALDVNANQVDVLTGSPDAFKLVVPVDESPVTMVGVPQAQRYYSISQNIPYLSSISLDGNTVQGGVACNIDPYSTSLPTGTADGIESATYSVSSHIQVGVCPDYAVGSLDSQRVFVLNRGSDSVSVINSQINAIDSCAPFDNQNGQLVTCHPSLPLSPANGLAHAGPVYAEYNQATQQLVVANYDGDSISIIDVSLDEYGNDSPTFGTTYTVPVGHNPASVTVLADGSRAYVANQSDSTVTIVNMISHTVEKTLAVNGHPRTVVSTLTSLYGKVYVVSPDSPYVTIIRTDQDIVGTNVLVSGNAVDVRTTSPDTINNNVNTVSRLPGAGQPCNLPPGDFTSAGAAITIQNCRQLDPTQL
jgi:YVTN family beta-propeller protein